MMERRGARKRGSQVEGGGESCAPQTKTLFLSYFYVLQVSDTARRGRCGGGKIPVTATSEKPHDLAGGLVLPLSEQTASETETQASILYATFNFAHYILYISEMSRRAKLRTDS